MGFAFLLVAFAVIFILGMILPDQKAKRTQQS